MRRKMGELMNAEKVVGFVVLGVGVVSLLFGVMNHDEMAIDAGKWCLIVALTILLRRRVVAAAVQAFRFLESEDEQRGEAEDDS